MWWKLPIIKIIPNICALYTAKHGAKLLQIFQLCKFTPYSILIFITKGRSFINLDTKISPSPKQGRDFGNYTEQVVVYFANAFFALRFSIAFVIS